MIRTIIDLIGFFNSLSGFLVAVFFWSILTITFAKSIKKHARFLYWVFGVMGGLSLLPILNIFGIDMVNIIYLPILGDIFIEFTFTVSDSKSCLSKSIVLLKFLSTVTGTLNAHVPHL